MNDKVHNGAPSVWRVLTEASIQQLDEKLAEAIKLRFAEITLVIENGKFHLIRGPAPSEPVKR
jgi:hypothetical protein